MRAHLDSLPCAAQVESPLEEAKKLSLAVGNKVSIPLTLLLDNLPGWSQTSLICFALVSPRSF